MPNKQEENEPKKEVLDLIGGSPKKKRAPQPEPVPAPAPIPRPAPAKKEALDLLSGPGEKSACSRSRQTGSRIRPASSCRRTRAAGRGTVFQG